VSLEDVQAAATHWHKKSSDPDWARAQPFDLDGDKIITTRDIMLAMARFPQACSNLIDLGSPNAVNAVLYGQEAEDFFGSDLAAGDLNSDGIDDLAVGAYLADGPANQRTGAGEVYVYFGRAAANWPAEGRLPEVTVYGAEAGHVLGGDDWKEPGHIAVGDLDHDGFGDLVLSVPKFIGPGLSRGRVYIIWGQYNWPTQIDLAAIPSQLEVTTVTAENSGRGFLGSTLAAGDLDGDSIDDLAMAAPLAETDARRLNSGIVYVIFGEAGRGLRGRAIRLRDVPLDPSIFTVVGEVGLKALGSFLVFGDLSHDGMPDLAIGSVAGGGEDRGTVDVVFVGPQIRGIRRDFLTNPPDWSAMGERTYDQLGRFLAVGDINADRRADLIMTAPPADGPAGPGTGQAIGIFGPLQRGTIRDLAASPGDLTIYGPQGGDDQAWLGESVAIGDFNDDGVDDLLVGARQANGFDTRGESGIVYLFYGGRSLQGSRDLRVDSADLTLVGAQADDFTGYVATGDLTGDGIDDIVISATDRAGPQSQSQAGAVYILFGD
jgi:hypothetical protein